MVLCGVLWCLVRWCVRAVVLCCVVFGEVGAVVLCCVVFGVWCVVFGVVGACCGVSQTRVF